MRYSLLVPLISKLIDASTCDKPGAPASSGVVLLQRPLVHVEQVDVDKPKYGALDVLTRPNVTMPDATGGTSLLELSPSLEHETLSQTFFVLISGEWSRWTPRKIHKVHGPHHFWNSVVVFDWCLFASAIMVFLVLHLLVLGRMEEKGWHLAVLCIWLIVGAVYNLVIWARFGSNAGISWFAGYLLEFIFLVENIFIFHIIIQAFKTPVKLTTKALHIVVWGQITFEMIFFMGLAAWLRQFKVLPYMLGVWLICCGFLAARGSPSLDNVDLMETSACRAFTSCLGDRLSPSYEKDGECLLRDHTGRMRVSLLGLVVVVLLTADFLLEIDVVLTKIEELPNPYIAFTSSAVAAFSIPELFFVSKGLLQRFKMLKYGIGFVLILFGAQMLLSSIYILRPIVACCIIIGVLAACVILSLLDHVIGVDVTASGRLVSYSPNAESALLQVGSGEAHSQADTPEADRPQETEQTEVSAEAAETTDPVEPASTKE